MIDSHCHLDGLENLDEVLKNAQDNGVEKILNIATQISDFENNFKIAEKSNNVFLSIGIHPEYADANVDFDEKIIYEYANTNKNIAIGEIGLDYYYENGKKENQISVFKKQLDIAEKLSLPVIIHTRNADIDMMDILKEYSGRINGVLHCFSSSFELCRFALEIGFYISASGIITFKNSFALRDIFKTVPLNRLLVETDAPYLAPHPLRGKKNEPAFVKHTLACLADIKNVSVSEMEKITTENFYNLFKKAKQI